MIWFNFMRQYFLWWKLHPAGYAISNSLDINHFWFSILVGFFLKHLLIRYGGIKKYQQAQPFFLGLILGEYTIGSIWTIVGNIIHQQIFLVGVFRNLIMLNQCPQLGLPLIKEHQPTSGSGNSKHRKF